MLKWFWLLRSATLRIPVLLLGCWLLFAGCQRVRHPALVMVPRTAVPTAAEAQAGFQPVVMTRSRVSSAGGVMEWLVGVGLVLYVAWPLRRRLARRL